MMNLIQVTIECDKTRYRAELEFKLKPFFGGAEASNAVVGKIKLGTKTIASLEGKWDGEITWKDENGKEVCAMRRLSSSQSINQSTD